jgi:hypothetical protein
MKMIILRITVPEMSDEQAIKLKQAVEQLIAKVENAEVELIITKR